MSSSLGNILDGKAAAAEIRAEVAASAREMIAAGARTPHRPERSSAA